MAAVDAKTRKAIHDDIDRTTIPQEMKLMYIVASACQSIVENVHRRVKSEFRKHGLIAGENELLTGLNDYCKAVKAASFHFYNRIDPPGTIRHVRSKGVEILPPKMKFFEVVEMSGCPTRRARTCCSHLKEYKVLDRAVQGIRRSESTKRAKRYSEPEICRVYSKSERVKLYLPILDWTDSDVERFVKERGITCHPLYYDEQGNFHVERRLGCLGCPLQSDNGVEDYLKYPKLLKRLIKSAQKWLDTHPNAESHKKFGNAYNIVFHNLFCDSYEDYKIKMGGVCSLTI